MQQDKGLLTEAQNVLECRLEKEGRERADLEANIRVLKSRLDESDKMVK